MSRGRRVAAAFVIAACFVFAPACGRKNKRVAAVPATPLPQSTAPGGTPPRNTAAQSGTPPPRRTQAGTARGIKPAPLPLGYVEEGVASWYGIPYHGRRAADGEIYDMETLVAAHRLMPFNTWLRVTNLANSKTVNVRIIDRGPFVDGRLIDLSKAAARQIELIGPGVGRVRLEVIGAPADIPADDFFAVQVGAFSVHENAERARQVYAQRFGTASLAITQGRITLWRVLVGKETSVEAAQRLATTLNTENPRVFVVRLDQVLPTQAADALPPPAATQASTSVASPAAGQTNEPKPWQTPDNIPLIQPTAAPPKF